MRVYPHYRDSGVEWLGEVPEHWEVRRLEHVAAYRTSNVDKKTADGELPVRLCNYTDVYYGDRVRAGEGEFMTATASAGEVERFKLRVGDVLITKDSEDWRDIAVPAVVDETADDFVCGYHLGIIRSGPETDPFFLYRAMQSGAVNRQLQTSASGVTRYGLPNAAVGDVLLPLPPLDEQRDIAAFLDGETERIDSLIAKKRLLIERLQEYRTALITRTVTRGLPPEAARAAGLDPSPRLKPSGVEWLGDVPVHWDVARLKWSRRKAINGVWGDEPDGENDIPCIRVADFDRRSLRVHFVDPTIRAVSGSKRTGRLLRPGDLLLEKSGGGEHQLVGCVVLWDHGAEAICSNFIARVAPAKDADPRYWVYVHAALYSGRLNYPAVKQTTGIQNVDSDAYFGIPVAFPPNGEQTQIADFLDRGSMRVDELLGGSDRAIERLSEYRSALITAAVTGKIDVRETTRTGKAGLE